MRGQTFKRCPCPPESLVDETGRRVQCGKRHGTWSYRHDLPTGADGRRRQAKQGGFATEKEAHKALTEALTRLDRNTYVDRTKLLVGDYLDQWLASRVNLRPASIVFYRSAVALYLKPQLGRHRLVDLRPVDVERPSRAYEPARTGAASPPPPRCCFASR